MERLYTMPEAAEAAGIKYRTLHSWMQRGLFQPSVPAQGTGRPARLTEHEVELCQILGQLRSAGCGLPILEAAVRGFGPHSTGVNLLLAGDVQVQASLRTNLKAVA
jgi:DNA-binding transcriptional MerR regulator